jgi:N-acetylmuramoyl-L-alanine amidase
VVLDAGNSGPYSNTKGSWDLLEKEATLDVVLRAKRLLEQSGYKVYLTRTGDTHIPLQDRAAFANKFINAVFVGVHFKKSLGGDASDIKTLVPLSLSSLLLVSTLQNKRNNYLEVHESSMHPNCSLSRRRSRA